MTKTTTWTYASLILGGLGGAAFLVSCLEPADEILVKSGEASRIVFVRETSVGDANRSIAMANNTNEFYQGTDLFLLTPVGPTGQTTNLTGKWTRTSDDKNRWGAATDPEVSFDGQRILFSMRESSNNGVHWHIYEMDAAGENKIQLTGLSGQDQTSDDMDPAYLPDGRIVFTSTRSHQQDEYERRPVSSLYIGTRNSDGVIPDANIRQLSFNQSHDFNPWVHSSGLIYFSRWDHLGSPNKIPLFSIHPDGTKQFVLYGADETFAGNGNGSGSRTFMEARELSDGGIVTSLMERTSQFEGGAIAVLDLGGKPITAAPDVITPAGSPYNTTQKTSEAIYKTPYPIMDGTQERILVAMSANETGGMTKNDYVNYDLYVMDKDGGGRKLIFANTETNDYDPIVIAPRHIPAIITSDNLVSEAMKNGSTTGTLFDANVYGRMENDGQLHPDAAWINHDGSKGQIRHMRILDAVAMPSNNDMRGGNLGETDFEKQRVIGYGPVESDGSFAIEVPANRSLHLQTLDEDGVMLVNQLQWIHVAAGERRVCTACHGPRELDKDIQTFKVSSDGKVTSGIENATTYMASFAKAVKATEHRAAKVDTVDFYDPVPIERAVETANALRNKQKAPIYSEYTPRTNTLQTIFDTKCNSCHSTTASEDQGGGLVLEEIRDSTWENDRVSTVYNRLTNGNGYTDAKGNKRNFVTSRGARQSPLAWVLFNRQLVAKKTDDKLFKSVSFDHSTLWDKDSTDFIDVFTPKNKDLLSLIEWMDMGAQFSNSVGKY